MSIAPSGALYDRIGVGYDGTRKADAYIADRMLHHLASKSDGRFLDLACGTGNYTSALAVRCEAAASASLPARAPVPADKNPCRWIGCDQSVRMLQSARDKNDHISWCASDALCLPFATAWFDGALCSNALHHFGDIDAVFVELRRVLKPRARAVIFSASAEQMGGYWLNAYFPHALRRSIGAMPSEQTLLQAIARANFSLVEREPYFIRTDLQDSFLFSGKHDPSRYLNAAIRAGISTFAALADRDEVAAGCERLERDIKSGEFATVAAKFDNKLGDYSFWILDATG